MTFNRLAELVKFTDRKRWPKFEMVIYIACVTQKECEDLVGFLLKAGMQDRAEHVADAATTYFAPFPTKGPEDGEIEQLTGSPERS